MEDIDFLRANSEKVSYMFYVDSNQRDKTLYPNPNEYAIQFTTPFKNVYAIEVVDASIPRTQYNVELDTNTLVYTIHDTIKTIRIDIGDYTSDTLIYELNTKLSSDEIIIEHLSSPSDKRKQFVFYSVHPFSFLIYKSTLGSVLGFNVPAKTKNVHTENERYSYHALDEPSYYTNNVVINRLTTTTYVVPLTATDVFKQYFQVTSSGYLNELEFMISNANVNFEVTIQIKSSIDDITLWKTSVNIQTSQETYKVSCNNIYILHGNAYFIQFHVSHYDYSDKPPTYGIYTNMINSTSNSNEQGLYIQNQPAFEFDLNLNTTNQSNNNTVGSYVYELDSSVQVVISLQCRLSMKIPRYTLIPPGIYNFIGERYVILKSKEIESNLLASSKSFDVRDANGDIKEESFDFGLAKFKMGVVGFSEERFDFNRLPPQEFHPIGKLYMLTFRFETPTKKLYDFKGVDHTITLIIKYYMPKMSFKERIESIHLLNTDYTPNIIEYDSKFRNVIPYDPSVKY
tara:strand:- start:134 stop:1672 length:1539 start_codon:yes stop_codon:yes gene_type:complete